MANAKIDENNIPTVLGTLQSDGQTTIPLNINPTNNAAKVIDDTTGTASTRINAPRDGNFKPAWIGVSSTDMITPIPVAIDSSGNLLIKST